VHFEIERRLPESAEAAADNIVAEAPTNNRRNPREIEAEAAPLRLSILDDGIGGADPSKGLDSSASSIASRRSGSR